ncbi:hypothetical protein HL653_11045 [Sphingomonas sp. AP4-R1]|uniref:hypothetical protein n=1 Tax=Sphingomonas sp. AP4-R1 TaxID=2735134 RepID=UPI0014936F72|nr:hypothetical protein [Sphingomonas sp. AP4-R1]QJU58254.1 hypothetical protein HL653_11045 [Sphingomonas sp. AP4-R1]
MFEHAKKTLPLVGGSLLLALTFSGCDRKSDQTVPPAANSVAVTPVATATAGDADANAMDAMSNQAAMEQHHRQAMDHDAMRAGAGNQSAPAPDPAPSNSAMPMTDM